MSVVRAVGPEERGIAVATCLVERGYDSIGDRNGAWQTDGIPPGQEEAFAIAEFECLSAYPYFAELNRPPTAEQLDWLYYYYTHSLTDCLESEGFAIFTPPPSRDVFIAALTGESDEIPWSPYNDVPLLADAADQKLRDTCPEFPDTYTGG